MARLTRMQYIGWDVIKSEEEENRYKMEDWEDWEKRYWGIEIYGVENEYQEDEEDGEEDGEEERRTGRKRRICFTLR